MAVNIAAVVRYVDVIDTRTKLPDNLSKVEVRSVHMRHVQGYTQAGSHLQNTVYLGEVNVARKRVVAPRHVFDTNLEIGLSSILA